MAACPAGHASAADDSCDLCGCPIAGTPAVDSAASKPSYRTQVVVHDVGGGRPTELCPTCGTPRSPAGRFCELDGHDFEAVAAAPPSWVMEVATDRDYFERCAPEGVAFPENTPMRSFKLEGSELMVGRRTGLGPGSAADDTTCGVADPAVSRRHARFFLDDDGCLAVVDEGSTNGTRLNGDEERLPSGAVARLTDGDRVHLGAWTTITVHLTNR